MKKTILTAIVVAMTMIVSCQKEELTMPVAAFTYENADMYMEGMNAPYTVEFTSTGENDLTSTCKWEFGDGSSETTKGTWVSHNFEKPKEYQVWLTITDKDGNEDLEIKSVLVEGAELSLKCYFDGGHTLCYNYTAKIYADYNDCMDNALSLDTQECDLDGVVVFKHLTPNKDYYIKAVSKSLYTDAEYNNYSEIESYVPFPNTTTDITAVLKYASK